MISLKMNKAIKLKKNQCVISYRKVELSVKHKRLVNNIIQTRSPITFGLFNMMVLKRQLDHKDKEFKNIDMRFSNP
jgi:hypothetical protein